MPLSLLTLKHHPDTPQSDLFSVQNNHQILEGHNGLIKQNCKAIYNFAMTDCWDQHYMHGEKIEGSDTPFLCTRFHWFEINGRFTGFEMI